jgi:hypothetical protein
LRRRSTDKKSGAPPRRRKDTIDRALFAIDHPWESTAEAVEFLRTAPYALADLERIAHGATERMLRL